ncbi:F-box/LRR-repeat protein At1g67190-like [Cucurbita pepo subsp. pepo]|uniref:F-box/LRR-repeat protein At1g67190-like n=1 Tax=Cucurbita pepo subsp. pepo TaxID=3664 RepID=UPI000C9D2F2D|nr:F-box/LRR-repeat protein At1g67190-like [Cucurbita pepo subsp. pepo]
MEDLPVEIIGKILSLLQSVQDLAIASTTCKKWREAVRNHLHTLSFHSDYWPGSKSLSTRRLEVIITQMILQTTGLENLYIFMDEVDAFSASSVTAWLMHTKHTVVRLHYNVNTIPSINIIEKCGRHKLEALALANNPIDHIEPAYPKLSCLNYLSLCYVIISKPDLNLLISACPNLKRVSVVHPEFTGTDETRAMEIRSSSLKEIFVDGVGKEDITLETDTLEILHLKDCSPEVFQLIGKGTLRVLKLEEVSAFELGIGDNTENLETVDLSGTAIVWQGFYHLLSKASMLKRLRLWNVRIYDSDEEVVDLGSISTNFPQLSQLSLSLDLRRRAFHQNLQRSFQMENVTILEVGWKENNVFFSEWVAKLVKICPKLKKLTIFGFVSGAMTNTQCHTLSSFATAFVELMRKYQHIQVGFVFA